MTEVFVIRNQLGHYWGKGKTWVDGTEPRTVMRAKHHDDAVNTLFELSSKDFELRGQVVAAQLSEKGEPLIEPSEHLLPKEPEPAAEGDTAATGDATQGEGEAALAERAGSA